MVMFARLNIALISNKSINKECANSCGNFKFNSNSSESLINRSIRDATSCFDEKITCLEKRYPLIMVFNFVMLIMMIVLIVFYLFNV